MQNKIGQIKHSNLVLISWRVFMMCKQRCTTSTHQVLFYVFPWTTGEGFSSGLFLVPRCNMKRPLQLEDQVVCGPYEVEHAARNHWRTTACFGNGTICVILAQPVGWEGYITSIMDLCLAQYPQNQLNWMLNLTCPLAESFLLTSWDRKNRMWPSLRCSISLYTDLTMYRKKVKNTAYISFLGWVIQL